MHFAGGEKQVNLYMNKLVRCSFLNLLYGCNIRHLPPHIVERSLRARAVASGAAVASEAPASGASESGASSSEARAAGAEVIAPRSVIKCLSMPYFDRALLEFIYYDRF